MLLNKFLKNSGYGIISQIAVLLLGVIFAGMTIRYLGPARAGFFLVASSILGWTQLAGAGSFKAPAVQKLALNHAAGDLTGSKQLLSTIISVNLLIALPFAIATILAFPVLFSWSQLENVYKEDAFSVVLFGSLAFLFDNWASGIRAVYEAHQRFKILTLTSVSFGLFGNIARLYILISFRSMASLAVVNLVISFVWLCTDVYIVYRILGGGVFPGWNWNSLKPLLGFGFWSWLGGASNVLYFNITSLILTKYMGSAYLPYVALPQRIVMQIHGFFISFTYSIFPTLAGQGITLNTDIERVEDRLRWVTATISLYAYTALCLSGPLLLTILVNKSFAEHAQIPLLLYCLWGIFSAQMIVYVFTTMAKGRAEANTITDIVVSIATVISTFLLIPIFGYIGVCLAQMWKLPGVIIHTFWSRRILGLKKSLWLTLAPMISPVVAVTTWIFITILGYVFFPHTPSIQLIFLIIGLVISFPIIWYCEVYYFSEFERWSTMSRSITLIIIKTKTILCKSNKISL